VWNSHPKNYGPGSRTWYVDFSLLIHLFLYFVDRIESSVLGRSVVVSVKFNRCGLLILSAVYKVDTVC
jgi:hypothetical protein